MKKYFTIIAALLAIAAVSCEKEKAIPEKIDAENNQTVETVTTGDGVVVLSASLPDVPDSRSVLGAKDGSVYHPLWTATDSIIVNGVASAEAQLSNGGRNAKFAVNGVSAPYIVLAPASQIRNSAYSDRHDEKKYDFLFPGAGRPQNYTVDGEGNPTFDPRVGLLAAYSEDENLSFKHLNVYFRITTTAGTDSDNIRFVYIRGGDGSKTAGTWTATYTDADHISVEPESLSSYITLDCGEGGVPQGTPVIVALPAYNYSTGLIVTIKDINGHFISFKIKESATDFSASAGTVYEFEREFSPVSGTISSEEDWNAFAEAINSKYDYDLYRWVGNGTVKLGADITAASLDKVTGKFPYTFDGQNHTITRTAASGALFRNVRGVVKNLNLAGTVTSVNTTCGSLADTLYNGGRISGCTNGADVSVNTEDNQTGSRLGGFVGIMTGGTIDNCTNNGSVYSSVDCSSKTIYNLQIGGIVGQVDGSQTDSGDAVLYNCINTGSVTADPVFKTTGHGYSITYAGAGGIAGWLRGTGHSFILNNCDNSGTVYYSAEQVTDPTGTKANSISVGGIVGIAGDQTGGNGYDSSVGTNGLDVTMRYCDNSGTIHNCGINYATSTTSNKRVYTGGITGSLVGTSAKYAKLARCRNTGIILTYDVTGDDASTRPVYCQVAGGLIGYGGYVAIDSCKVNCTIGNGKRQSLALGGAIGHTMAPFTADRDTVWFTGYFVRVNGSNHINSSSFATVVKKWTSSNNQNPLPAITGSSISNSRLGAVLYYYETTAGDLADNSANCTNSTTLGAGNTSAVRGQGYNTSELISPDVSFTGNITINSNPDL